uniref:Phycoerythrin alpha subunit S1 n=2 Tax=Chroomonas sp. M1627 TaxID=478123 RepID=A0A067XP68_9CRYP|nr:phycoerythrin alpha subunit S2 [Chroomonas sp. M1627]AGR45594.1 phycoerythrin alpha subunit S1 [Chroomonas sp. M1627]
MIAKTVATLAVIGSAAAYAPTMSLSANRREVIAGAGAAAVAAPLLRPTGASAAIKKDQKAPVVTIFDARGCKDHSNKEYTGAKAGGMEDDQCVKLTMETIKVGDDVAAKVLGECLSELKSRK